MGFFDKGIERATGYSKNNKPEPKTTNTLVLLKDQLKVESNGYNSYNKYWLKNYKADAVTPIKLQAQIIDNCVNGIGKFYANNINDDIIASMVRNITNEVFNDITFNLIIKQTEENQEIERQESFQSPTKSNKLFTNKGTFKNHFEYLYKYQKIGIKKNIVDGNIILIPLKPYEYHVDKTNTIDIHATNEDGTTTSETKKGTVEIIIGWDGEKPKTEITPLEDKTFFELTFDSRLFNKLEVILDYQMTNSNLTKEIELNKTKIHIDKKMYQSDTINTEVYALVNVPASISKDQSDAVQSHFQTKESKNGLNEMGGALDRKAKQLVGAFRLSRKTLGLSESQDFASSLPYENDLTAKTINAYRDYIGVLLSGFLNHIFDKTNILVDCGKYSLTSQESVADKHLKAKSGNIADDRKGISEYYGIDYDSNQCWTIYLTNLIHTNSTMTLQEEIKAGELELMPHLVDPEMFGG